MMYERITSKKKIPSQSTVGYLPGTARMYEGGLKRGRTVATACMFVHGKADPRPQHLPVISALEQPIVQELHCARPHPITQVLDWQLSVCLCITNSELFYLDFGYNIETIHLLPNTASKTRQWSYHVLPHLDGQKPVTRCRRLGVVVD
jgi:hypothetical protein